jgi:hypothetical protein
VPRLLVAPALAAVLGVTSSAFAQEGQLQLPKAEEADTGTVRPAAPDTRTGHVYLTGGVGAVGAAGSVSARRAASSVMGPGLVAGGALGFGITRHASLHILGDYTMFAHPAACTSGCSGNAFSFGLGVTYHLAQGTAFDAWGSYGFAFRSSSFKVPFTRDGYYEGHHVLAGQAKTTDGLDVVQTFRGFDVARIAFGGDFYPTPWFGFGPFIEATFGTNFRYPVLYPDARTTTAPEDQVGMRTYALFQIGFRIAFDPLRRAQPRPGAPSSAAASLTPTPGF